MVKNMINLFKKKKEKEESTDFNPDDLPPLPPLHVEERPRKASMQNLNSPKPRFPEQEPFLPEHHKSEERHEEQRDSFETSRQEPQDLPVSRNLKTIETPISRTSPEPLPESKARVEPRPEVPQKLSKRETSEPKTELPNLKEIAAHSEIKNEPAQKEPAWKKEPEPAETGWRKEEMKEETRHEEEFKPHMPEERPVITQSDMPIRSKARVFVKLDKYNEVLRTVNSIENKINDLQNTIRRINSLKTKEKEIIDNWDQLLTATKNTISDVNAKLPSPEER